MVGLRAGVTMLVTGAEARHALLSLRMSVGEPIEIVDGRGTRVTGVVGRILGSDVLEVEVSIVVTESVPALRFTVVQALPKGEHGELAVDLLTQIGADVILPWSASRSITRWAGDRAVKSRIKWQQAADAAAKQCRRSQWPLVGDLVSSADVAALITSVVAGDGIAIILHEEATCSMLSLAVATDASRERVVIVVGPEGGISAEESEVFQQAGANLARLGPSVLRSSSAGAFAVALLSAARNWPETTMGGSGS